MLTTDVGEALRMQHRLLKKANNYQELLQVKLSNPVSWLITIFQEKGETENDTN